MFKKFQALTKGGKYAYEMLVPKISKKSSIYWIVPIITRIDIFFFGR